MINFLEHLARENDTMKATRSWIMALKEKGLIVKARALPTLAGIGEGAEMLGMIAGPDYVTAEDMLEDLYIAGVPMNCKKLKQEPYVRAVHLDHDKTLEAFRDKGIVKIGDSFKEAIQYLSQLRQYGVNISSGKWEEVLAEEHMQVMNTPLKEVELYAASGRLMPKCNPGWTSAHLRNARYRLVGKWNDNPILRGIIENYHDEGRFKFTDGICDKCVEELE